MLPPGSVDRAALGFFRRSTIRVRLTVAFLSLAFTVFALGGFAAWQLQGVADAGARGADPKAAARSAQALLVAITLVLFALAFGLTANLGSALADVVRGAHTGTESGERIVRGNEDLAQRTEERATRLQETASSLEQLTSPVSQNADHAREASELAAGATAGVRRGGAAVDPLVEEATQATETMNVQAEALLAAARRFDVTAPQRI